MNFHDLSKKTEADLRVMLAERREELRELRFLIAANQLTDVRDVREAKRDIARILTRLSQMKLEDNVVKEESNN